MLTPAGLTQQRPARSVACLLAAAHPGPGVAAAAAAACQSQLGSSPSLLVLHRLLTDSGAGSGPECAVGCCLYCCRHGLHVTTEAGYGLVRFIAVVVYRSGSCQHNFAAVAVIGATGSLDKSVWCFGPAVKLWWQLLLCCCCPPSRTWLVAWRTAKQLPDHAGAASRAAVLACRCSSAMSLVAFIACKHACIERYSKFMHVGGGDGQRATLKG